MHICENIDLYVCIYIYVYICLYHSCHVRTRANVARLNMLERLSNAVTHLLTGSQSRVDARQRERVSVCLRVCVKECVCVCERERESNCSTP